MGLNQYDEEIEGQMSFYDYFPVPQRMFAVSKIFARARKQMNVDEYKDLCKACYYIWKREYNSEDNYRSFAESLYKAAERPSL